MADLFKIDTFLVSLTEKITQTIEKYTGINNFILARWIWALALTMSLSSVLKAFLEYKNWWELLLMPAVGAFMVWMLFMIKRRMIGTFVEIEQKTIERASKGFSNELKRKHLLHRYGFYCYFCYELLRFVIASYWPDIKNINYFFFGCISIGMFVIFLLLVACDPLPPGKSKILDWIKSLKNFFTAQEPDLAPAPTK